MPNNKKGFEEKYQSGAHFIELMMNGEKITPETEVHVREKAIMALYFAYTGVKLPTGSTLGEVAAEAGRIVKRYQDEHPYQFNPGKETRIDILKNKVMKLEKDLADVKAEYETIMFKGKRIRFKFWPSEKGSNSDEAPQYVGLLTRVKPEMIEGIEREISKKHQIKGIFCPKS